MDMHQYQSGIKQERKKDLYILSLDSGRVFWVVTISLLVLVFLFLLGYWIGHDQVTVGGGESLATGVESQRYGEALSFGFESNRNSPRYRAEFEEGSNGEVGLIARLDGGASDRLESDSLEANEKPRIDESRLPTKTEKSEYEILKTKPKPVAATKPVPATTPSKPVESAPVKSVPQGRYSVQVASLSTQAAADSFAGQLKGKQYQTSVLKSQVNGKDFYRVRVGGYESYEAAQRVVENLKASGDGPGAFIIQN